MLKRKYLNTEEKNFYFVAKAFIQYINGQRNLNNRSTEEIWEEWKKHGMITPSMQKNLKLVKAYLNKFCFELEDNLDKEQLEKLNKQLLKFDYKLIDDYTLKKMLRNVEDHMQYVSMKRDYFIEILEDVAEHKCVNCQQDYRSCPLYKALDDINVPPDGEEPNCPYAANMVLTKGDLKDIKKIKAKIDKGKKKRKEA